MNAINLRIFALIFVVGMSTGCASITRGTSEAYAIETVPPGATAILSSGETCETPCSVKVKRRSDFTVTLERDGYEPVTASITSSIDGAGAAGMAGNVLVGGIIGAGIDAGTGAMHSHKPNPLVVTMVPDDAPPGTEAITNIPPEEEEAEESDELSEGDLLEGTEIAEAAEPIEVSDE